MGAGLLACYEWGLLTALDLIVSRAVSASGCSLHGLNQYVLTGAHGLTPATTYD